MTQNNKLIAQAKNLVVLYVEDEDNTRQLTSDILKLFFGKVIIAANGLDALNKYKKKEVDLVMTDLTMPVMCGLDMIKEIKNIKQTQHIIVLTAHNSSENLMETIDLQLDGFLLKPIKMDKVVNLLLKVTNIINLEKNEKKCLV